MDSSLAGLGGAGGNITPAQKQQLMEQVKAQIAVANAQELLQVSQELLTFIEFTEYLYQ